MIVPFSNCVRRPLPRPRTDRCCTRSPSIVEKTGRGRHLPRGSPAPSVPVGTGRSIGYFRGRIAFLRRGDVQTDEILLRLGAGLRRELLDVVDGQNGLLEVEPLLHLRVGGV